MAPGFMDFVRNSLGLGRSSSGAGKGEKAGEATEYEGFTIVPAPRRHAAGWLTAGTITKSFPDGVKQHQFIRADTYADWDDAVAFCVRKAKQLIDEQGDRLFGS
jgi:hypothetical protein